MALTNAQCGFDNTCDRLHSSQICLTGNAAGVIRDLLYDPPGIAFVDMRVGLASPLSCGRGSVLLFDEANSASQKSIPRLAQKATSDKRALRKKIRFETIDPMQASLIANRHLIETKI